MYPSEKELLDISTRKNLKIDDLVGLVSQIECQLDDQILLQKLRQLRNTFATGGRELFDGANNFDYNLIDEKLFPLFDEFLFGNQWKSGVVLVLQIYSNLVEKHNINLLARFDENLTVSAIENFEKINDGVSNYLAAYIFISQKPKKYLLFDAKVYTIYLWYFLRSSSATEKDGWHILLFNHLFQYFPSVYTEMIEMKSVEQFPDQFIGLLELFTAKLKEVRIEDDMNEISVFNVDIIHKLKELFFDLCNGLLLAGKNNELPFGARSELLFELLSFLSICSARMKTVLSTEAMIVAICGILKRCWEISQERAKELQPKLTKDGNLPKKSEYIELMFSVWKDAVRILGTSQCIFNPNFNHLMF